MARSTTSALPFLLQPPCLNPALLDMRDWKCVVALNDTVKGALENRFGEGLLVTAQYWSR